MTPQSQSQIDAATNRIKAAQMPVAGFSYDAAGNLDGDPTTGTHHIGYDAENHQTSYNNGAATYVYDGEGRRVKKVVAGSPSVTTIYVYNAMGQMIAEYKDQATSGTGGTQFVASDHLGSTRVLMNSSGTVTARYDYLPFGEEIPSSLGGRSAIVGYNPTATINEKFTQKERDSESGLDYFLARYYSSAQGRFTSSDPDNAGANHDDPQSWDGYVYARNNPLLFTDPNGETYVISGPAGSGALTDEVFYGEKRHFEGLGFIFTGNGTFFESGNIVSPDGQVVASYRQVSIDDRLQQFALQMARRAPASLKLIDIAANITLTPISIISGTGVFRAGIYTLAKGAAEASAIRIGARGLAHVLARHVAGGAKTAGKSLFHGGETEVVSLIRGAGSVARAAQPNGNFARVVDAGRIIGLDRLTGAPTSVYTVITDTAERLVAAFPGRP